MKKRVKKGLLFLVVLVIAYVFIIPFRGFVNFINPLTKHIVAMIGENEIEKKYNIKVDVYASEKFFLEPSEYCVYMKKSSQPDIKFEYVTNYSLSKRTDNYLDSVFDYVSKRELSDEWKKIFKDEFVKYEQRCSLKPEAKKIVLNRYLNMNTSSLNIEYFKDDVDFIESNIYLKSNNIDIDYSEFYNLIKYYQSFPTERIFIKLYSEKEDPYTSILEISFNKDKINSEEELKTLVLNKISQQ